MLEEEQKFCPDCGQKTDTARLTFLHFIHELLHAFTHADKGIFHLIKGLSTQPGTVAREYIAGKRKSYFNPYTFFILMAGLFVLSNIYFKPPAQKIEPNPNVVARIPTEKGKQNYVAMMHRVSKSTGFMNKHGNVVAMIAVPVISLLTWGFFYKRKFNYVEHLTANMLFLTFSNLIFTILVFPIQSLFSGADFVHYFTYAALFLQALYLAWCLNGFLSLITLLSRLKSVLVSFFVIIFWMFFSMSLMALYIYQNKNFYQFFERMFSQ
jgi:hypothetical protein